MISVTGKVVWSSGLPEKSRTQGVLRKEACVSIFGHTHTLQGSYSDVRIVSLRSVWGGGCGTQYCLWATLSDTLSNLE